MARSWGPHRLQFENHYIMEKDGSMYSQTLLLAVDEGTLHSAGDRVSQYYIPICLHVLEIKCISGVGPQEEVRTGTKLGAHALPRGKKASPPSS